MILKILPVDDSDPNTVKTFKGLTDDAANVEYEPSASHTVELVESPREAERQKQLDAFLRKHVPNQSLWPELRLRGPPTDALKRSEMPFDQSNLLVSKNATGACYGIVDSILFPYVMAMAMTAGSLVVIFRSLHDWIADVKEPRDALFLWIDVLFQSIPGFMLIGTMTEAPARVFLYRRLWEQKIIIDFEPRPIFHHLNNRPSGFLAIAVTLAIIAGRHAVFARSSYLIALLQPYATFAWVIFSNHSIEKYLVQVQPALRFDRLPVPAGCLEEPDEREPALKFAAMMQQMGVIPEAKVRNDLVALSTAAKALRTQLRAARRDKARLAQLWEELWWLKICSLYVGRLGHPNSTVRNPNYALGLFTAGLYDDALWHRRGSFANEPSKTGRVEWFSLYLVLPFFANVALVVALLASIVAALS